MEQKTLLNFEPIVDAVTMIKSTYYINLTMYNPIITIMLMK
jgi:hypothetical protein